MEPNDQTMRNRNFKFASGNAGDHLAQTVLLQLHVFG